ncbi:MAG TPA: hypothetical protein ENI87_05385 [bacterium]|nr:hypothetical protein [bacterium]
MKVTELTMLGRGYRRVITRIMAGGYVEYLGLPGNHPWATGTVPLPVWVMPAGIPAGTEPWSVNRWVWVTTTKSYTTERAAMKALDALVGEAMAADGAIVPEAAVPRTAAQKA